MGTIDLTGRHGDAGTDHSGDPVPKKPDKAPAGLGSGGFWGATNGEPGMTGDAGAHAGHATGGASGQGFVTVVVDILGRDIVYDVSGGPGGNGGDGGRGGPGGDGGDGGEGHWFSGGATGGDGGSGGAGGNGGNGGNGGDACNLTILYKTDASLGTAVGRANGGARGRSGRGGIGGGPGFAGQGGTGGWLSVNAAGASGAAGSKGPDGSDGRDDTADGHGGSMLIKPA